MPPMISKEWFDRAACLGAEQEAFYSEDRVANNAAIVVCQSCPEQANCLMWAIEHNEKLGVWGGLLPRQRRNFKKLIGYQAPSVCGTPQGYRRHLYREEPVCPRCHVAWKNDKARRESQRRARHWATSPTTTKRKRRSRLVSWP